VDVSPDLKHARVFVSAMQDREETLDGLNRAAPFLRRALARRAGLRFTPQLRFLLDESIVTGFQVEEILRDVAPEDEPDEGESR